MLISLLSAARQRATDCRSFPIVTMSCALTRRELRAGRRGLARVEVAPVPAAGLVRVRARRLVRLAPARERVLADLRLQGRLVRPQRLDLRGRAGDPRLVERGGGGRRGARLRGDRAGELGVDRLAEDELRHRDGEDECHRDRERGPRDDDHGVPDPLGAEALLDEPFDQREENRPGRPDPQHAVERRVPPARDGDADDESAQKRERDDRRAERRQEAELARDVAENAPVGASEPRPANRPAAPGLAVAGGSTQRCGARVLGYGHADGFPSQTNRSYAASHKLRPATDGARKSVRGVS